MSTISNTDSLFQELLSRVSEALENNGTISKDATGKFDFVTRQFLALTTKFPLLPSALFLTIAVFLIILGSFASIQCIPTTALPPTNEHILFDPTDNDLDHECDICFDGEYYAKDGEITTRQAFALPLVGSVSLLSLYFLVKYTGLKWMQLIIKILRVMTLLTSLPAHFLSFKYMIDSTLRQLPVNSLRWNARYRLSFADDNKHISEHGIVENFNYVDKITNEKPAMPEMKNRKDEIIFKRELRLPTALKPDDQILNVYFNQASIFASLLSIAAFILTVIYGENNWLIDNMNAANFAIYAISTLTFPNLKNASMTMILFFFYDIFFVFGNDVMVTVATKVDIPAKIILPTGLTDATANVKFSLLGLGDIIIPGLLVSLCYRFDVWKWHHLNTDQEFHLKRWSYIGCYTYVSLLAYVLGLCACTFVLHYYRLPQPALLYLVPSMLLSVVTLATARSDLRDLWSFNYSTIVSPRQDSEPIISLSDFESEFEGEFEGEGQEENKDPEYTAVDAIMDSEGESQYSDLSSLSSRDSSTNPAAAQATWLEFQRTLLEDSLDVYLDDSSDLYLPAN